MRSLMLCIALILCGQAAVVHAADRPNNPVGVHLMIHDYLSDENIDKHTAWARAVCGPWGYVKIFHYGITTETEGPSKQLIKLVETLYDRELIPVLRLGGRIEGGIWQRPSDAPDGTFGDIAQAFKRVVADVPRSDQCPLYIEVWNEANLGLEWSGKPRPADFAKMYVAAAKAIRSIGDPRIQVAPGAMSPGGEYNSLDFIDAMCEAEPEFIRSFDYWCTHPYPQGTPPEYNIHDQTTTNQFSCIDLWLYELQRLNKHGCDISKLKVMGTETGYGLGAGGGDGYPMIDSEIRADYHLRTFRDYWMQWPEVLGMCIWDFANPHHKMNKSTWVHADDRADERGWPDEPTLDFKYVAALAKPTSNYASVSGKAIDARTGAGVPGVNVFLQDTELATVTDRFGNFILSPVHPSRDSFVLRFLSDTHNEQFAQVSVRSGHNSVVQQKMNATSLARVIGKVIDTSTGKPIKLARVSAEPGHFGTRTNDDGMFILGVLPHGFYRITVTQDGYYPHEQKSILAIGGEQQRYLYRLGPGEPSRENLLSNPGFEQVNEGSAAALAWNTEASTAGLRMNGDHVYAGDYSQQMIASADHKPKLIQWTPYSSIEAGRRYRLECWVRTEGVEGTGLQLRGTVVTNPHKTLDTVEADRKITGDTRWTRLSIDFKAPEDAGRVSAELILDADKGTCWIDQAAVFQVN